MNSRAAAYLDSVEHGVKQASILVLTFIMSFVSNDLNMYG